MLCACCVLGRNERDTLIPAGLAQEGIGTSFGGRAQDPVPVMVVALDPPVSRLLNKASVST
jgi:hypothetical protein